MDNLTIIISAVSIIISIIAIWISIKGMNEQKRLASISNNHLLLAESTSLIIEHPKLLELHNITTEELQNVGVSEIELIYTWKSMQAAQVAYDLDYENSVDYNDFSSFRKNLLDNQKVKNIWINFIRPKLAEVTPFVKAVDEFYKVN